MDTNSDEGVDRDMLEFDNQLIELPSKFRRYSKPLGLAASFLAVGFLGVTDYLTGSELSFSIFYLLPISFTTLYNGRAAGLLVSLVSAATWTAADLAGGAHYSHMLIPFWNGVVRLGYFALHTLLLTVLLATIHKMQSMALRDPLTGASNWRFFEETMRKEVERMRRSRSPLTLCYLDLDNFKSVNDTFGHGAGDDLLKTVVDTVQATIRPSDLLARTGGDEFAILLPDTASANAAVVLSRLREEFNARMAALRFPVTMSVGAVTYNALPSSVEAMVKRADELMYTVKKDGKNNVRYEEWPQAADKN